MKIDDYGRTFFSAEELFDLLYRGEIIDNLYSHGEEITQYNNLCRVNDKLNFLLPAAPETDLTSEEYHRSRQSRWTYPADYDGIDLWEILRGRCNSAIELDRLEQEIVEYQKRDLLPLLRLMLFLVDDFRKRNIVWGVGRGSSVASFALFLIGITKINPLKYDLEIGDFLKD